MIAMILIYALMAVFDIAMLGGCAYLMIAHGWSAWWMLLAVLMCAGSSPNSMIRAFNGAKEK